MILHDIQKVENDAPIPLSNTAATEFVNKFYEK